MHDEFNIHGVLATTMPVGPVIVCSGPGTARDRDELAACNVLGQGNRANSTIGRALQLVVRNVGGGRPGEVDRATHGNPGKLGFCFAENDARVAVRHARRRARRRRRHRRDHRCSPARGRGASSTSCRATPSALARSLAASLQTLHHPKLVLGFDAILVIGPEHARVFAEAGWDRERRAGRASTPSLTPAGTELVRGAGGIAEGLPDAFADVPSLPKFRAGGLLLAYAGGGAGLFSAIIGGWANGAIGSTPGRTCTSRSTADRLR